MITIKKILLYPFRFIYYKTPLRAWWLGDHWALGKLVEIIYGDIVNIDGLKIDISNPAITTAIKCRFILDRYEPEERETVKKFLDETTPVIELGGSIGVVSCTINKILLDQTKHVVVEANPNLIPTLQKNRDQNNCKFEILNKAIGYGSKRINFFLHKKFIGGSTQRETEKSVFVEATSLSNLINRENFNKVNLVSDIEGAEIEMIKKEISVLKEKVDIFIVGFHPGISKMEEIKEAKKIIQEDGFQTLYDQKQTCVFKNKNF